MIALEKLPERFRSKIHVNDHGCWMWTACTTADGYGRYVHEGKVVRTHRLAYEYVVGPIPPGLDMDHFRLNEGPRNAPCSRACCNPEHTEPVTNQVNAQRGAAGQFNSKKTHCPKGHEYSDSNTYTSPSGRRMCRTCTTVRQRGTAETRAAKAARRRESYALNRSIHNARQRELYALKKAEKSL